MPEVCCARCSVARFIGPYPSCYSANGSTFQEFRDPRWRAGALALGWQVTADGAGFKKTVHFPTAHLSPRRPRWNAGAVLQRTDCSRHRHRRRCPCLCRAHGRASGRAGRHARRRSSRRQLHCPPRAHACRPQLPLPLPLPLPLSSPTPPPTALRCLEARPWGHRGRQARRQRRCRARKV